MIQKEPPCIRTTGRQVWQLMLLALMIGAFVACTATRPSPTELASAYFGEPLSAAEAQGTIEHFMRSVLKDPDSAQYEGWTEPRKAWVTRVFRGSAYGWLVSCSINAKNSYGAYTGFQRRWFLFQNGALLDSWGEAETVPRDVYGNRDLAWGFID